MGISPAPGLIDCSIECINRGSIRKAKVSIKAYNKFQFEFHFKYSTQSNNRTVRIVGLGKWKGYEFDKIK